MRGNAEFWMRIAIAVGFVLILWAAPMILFPFTVSLIIAILLNPLAKWIHEHVKLFGGLKKIPYDVAILISFAIFVAVIYMIMVHIFVPFVSEFREFIKGIPDMIVAVQ